MSDQHTLTFRSVAHNVALGTVHIDGSDWPFSVTRHQLGLRAAIDKPEFDPRLRAAITRAAASAMEAA